MTPSICPFLVIFILLLRSLQCVRSCHISLCRAQTPHPTPPLISTRRIEMSMPMYEEQEEQPPPISMAQQSQHESVGPVVGVLVVIIVLGVIAVMIGRLCSGRRIMGHGQYDVESWAERKCSTCIDGRLNLSVSRVNEPTTSLPQETKQAEQPSQSSPPNL